MRKDIRLVSPDPRHFLSCRTGFDRDLETASCLAQWTRSEGDSLTGVGTESSRGIGHTSTLIATTGSRFCSADRGFVEERRLALEVLGRIKVLVHAGESDVRNLIEFS